MKFFNRKNFKLLFSFACAIVVAFMVGYWYYKYEIEDRDIGVVDYSPLINAEEVELQVVSVCFNNPFLKDKLQGINSSISVDTNELNMPTLQLIWTNISYPAPYWCKIKPNTLIFLAWSIMLKYSMGLSLMKMHCFKMLYDKI